MAKKAKETTGGSSAAEAFWNTGFGNHPFFQPGKVIPTRDMGAAKLPGVGKKVKGADLGMGNKGGKFATTTYTPTKTNPGKKK